MLFLQPEQYLRSVDQAGALSLRGPKKDLKASAQREFDGMGWDGVERKIKSVFQFSLYFKCI